VRRFIRIAMQKALTVDRGVHWHPTRQVTNLRALAVAFKSTGFSLSARTLEAMTVFQSCLFSS
jgi:hypothetical protein